MLVLPRISFKDAGAMRVIKQMGPAILGVSVSQISLIINTIFASFRCRARCPDVLRRSSDGVSIRGAGRGAGDYSAAVAVESFASGNHDEYCRLMDWGLRLCFLLALPSAVALGIRQNR